MRKLLPFVICLLLASSCAVSSFAKEKLAVMDLKADYGVSTPLAVALSRHIRDQIHNHGAYEVMSKEDVYAIVDRIQCIQQSGAVADIQCLVDAAHELGTRYMVIGSVSKLGSTYSIHLRLLDTGEKDPGVRKRANQDCRCAEDDLIQAAREVADLLMTEEPPGPSNNQRKALDTSTESEADLAVEQAIEYPEKLAPGKEYLRTITVTNKGPSYAQGVVVGDAIPVGILNPEWSLSDDERWNRWVGALALGSIPGGGAKQVRIRAFVDSGKVGLLTHKVTVLSETRDPDTSNNTSMILTGVLASTTPGPSVTELDDRRKTQSRQEWKDPVTGMEFVWVPGGCYEMGSWKLDERLLG